MISAINGINSAISAYSIYSTQQALTEQTRSQLESMGINTAGIKTEAQGQVMLQQSQVSQGAQDTNIAQNTQSSQQAPPPSGGNPLMDAMMEDALSLAQKIGANVSFGDDFDTVMAAISDRITEMQTEAANNPLQMAKVTEYQAEYMSLCELANSIQASMQESGAQKTQVDTSNTIETSMSGLANYNMASMSISNSNKLKL